MDLKITFKKADAQLAIPTSVRQITNMGEAVFEDGSQKPLENGIYEVQYEKDGGATLTVFVGVEGKIVRYGVTAAEASKWLESAKMLHAAGMNAEGDGASPAAAQAMFDFAAEEEPPAGEADLTLAKA